MAELCLPDNIAGHRGLVSSAIMRKLLDEGCQNLVVRTHKELDLTDQSAVGAFFDKERPGYVFLAAGRVGGILANDTYPAEFIRDNLMIQANVIDLAKLAIKGDSAGIAEDERRFGAINGDFRSNLNALLALSPFCCGRSEIGTQSVVLWGTGAPRREFLFVDDLANACVHLMREYESKEIINVGTGEDLTIRELAETVAEVVGYQDGVSFDSSKPD
ncbi:MAG: NAD-dependent epimerase/dehydratase family protein, partial [Syntrophobacteraceae bacterium]